MTKQQKIDFINEVNDKFINARNHGHSGYNWWYPKPNVIAYNVKLHGGGYIDIDELRKKLTPRQNDYYSKDEQLWDIIQQMQYDTAYFFSDEIDTEYGVKSGYAGRSGGWLEVEYNNPLIEVDDNTATSDINYYYKEAKKLSQLESDISEHIKKSHSNYIKYIGTESHYNDIIEQLLPDNEIAEIYKGKIKRLTDKLK